MSDPTDPSECDREDCRQIAATASDVYCEITGGLLSYPTYDARTILAHASDETQKFVDEEIAALRVQVEQLTGDLAMAREMYPGEHEDALQMRVERDGLAAQLTEARADRDRYHTACWLFPTRRRVMCEVGAHCPNCGRPDLDDFEIVCIGTSDRCCRRYECPCGARVSVDAPLLVVPGPVQDVTSDVANATETASDVTSVARCSQPTTGRRRWRLT